MASYLTILKLFLFLWVIMLFNGSYACRRVVSLWTCSKMCAITFVIGVVVGFSLKRSLRRWAGKLLKKLKDDWSVYNHCKIYSLGEGISISLCYLLLSSAYVFAFIPLYFVISDLTFCSNWGQPSVNVFYILQYMLWFDFERFLFLKHDSFLL